MTPADWSGARTSGSSRSSRSTACSDQHARVVRAAARSTTSRVPDASPRSVTALPGQPLRQVVVGQPDAPGRGRDGRLDLAQPRPAGDRERGHRHRTDALGPYLGHRVPPPVAAVWGAERVSFQSTAGRKGIPGAIEDHQAVLLRPDADGRDVPRRARSSPARPGARVHQPCGSLSRAPPVPVTSWGARPRATWTPVSASITTTVVDWVELSTPATRRPVGRHRRDPLTARPRRAGLAWAPRHPRAPGMRPGRGGPRRPAGRLDLLQPLRHVGQVVGQHPRLGGVALVRATAGCPHRNIGRARWGRC